MRPACKFCVLPAAARGWEVWGFVTGSAVLEGSFEEAAAAAAAFPGAILGLPSKWCRTFSFRLPPVAPKLDRALAWTQLEKRGLTQTATGPIPYSCHRQTALTGTSGAWLTVDVPTAAPAVLSNLLPPCRGMAAAVRFHNFSLTRMTIFEEQGRLVLSVPMGQSAGHVQILGTRRQDAAALGREISLVRMTLQQQGLLPALEGIDCAFSPDGWDKDTLVRALPLPITWVARPLPHAVHPDPWMQLPGFREQQNRQRRRRLMLAGLALVPLLPVLWWQQQRVQLQRLEAKADALEAALAASSGADAEARAATGLIRSTQERWQALRPALDLKRYPLLHLEHLTRCLAGGEVVITRFECRGPDYTVAGTAQSPSGAYQYFTSVRGDADLKTCTWSMAEPQVRDNGTAQFELKGKLR